MPSRPAAPTCLALAAGLLLGGAGLTGCAPTNANTTYTAGSIGVAAPVHHGTIIGMQPVAIRGSQTGLGATVGGVAGGIAGSTIGGTWQARSLAGVGIGLVGAGIGALAERGLTQGTAVQFTIRPDGPPDGSGPDYTVVQTNELNLQVGDRVAVAFGDRARLQRVAVVPGSHGAQPYDLPRGYGQPVAQLKR